jgi:glycosyltransferase involved in cell wall biosynthesis
MKFCWAVPIRNKARTLRRTVNAVLAQECEAIEILFSDQMSDDGSWELLQEITSKYDGPHKLRVMRCPEIEYAGMAGLNVHLNWQHNQTEADVIISSSADDMPTKDRARRTMHAFREHDPHMVLTAQYFLDEEGQKLIYAGETGWPDADGWVKHDEVYTRAIGGSTTQSWTRKFYEQVGGLQGLGSPDMVLPFIAAALGKCWYVNQRLHYYVKVSDPNNTGLEGIMRATRSASELLELEELCHMQVSCGIFTAAQKLNDAGGTTIEATNSLVAAIVDRAASWQRCRQAMALKRLQPRAIHV